MIAVNDRRNSEFTNALHNVEGVREFSKSRTANSTPEKKGIEGLLQSGSRRKISGRDVYFIVNQTKVH